MDSEQPDSGGFGESRFSSPENLRKAAVVTTLPVLVTWIYLLVQINWMVVIRDIPEVGIMRSGVPISNINTAFGETMFLLVTTWYGNLTVASALIASGLWWLGDRVEQRKEVEKA